MGCKRLGAMLVDDDHAATTVTAVVIDILQSRIGMNLRRRRCVLIVRPLLLLLLSIALDVVNGSALVTRWIILKIWMGGSHEANGIVFPITHSLLFFFFFFEVDPVFQLQ